MQQMLQHIDAMQEHLSPMAYNILKEKAESLISEEKDTVEDAFQEGKWNGWEAKEGKSALKDSSQYYNETFN